MVATKGPRKVACAACNTVFTAAPLDEAMQAPLQQAIEQCSEQLAPPEPESTTQTLCFQLATPVNKFSYDRLLKLEELGQAYSGDIAKADKQFKNKSFCFPGNLSELTVFESFASASLTSPDSEFPVFCTFSGDRDLLRGLSTGDTLLVQGTCRGLTDTSGAKGCVFSNCALLAHKGRVLAPKGQPPQKAHQIKPKSDKNPYDLHIFLQPAPAAKKSE